MPFRQLSDSCETVNRKMNFKGVEQVFSMDSNDLNW